MIKVAKAGKLVKRSLKIKKGSVKIEKTETAVDGGARIALGANGVALAGGSAVAETDRGDRSVGRKAVGGIAKRAVKGGDIILKKIEEAVEKVANEAVNDAGDAPRDTEKDSK
jgi:hypothetical protein